MKLVRRFGVFETNSSSTHTLVLVSLSDYNADKISQFPRYVKFGVAASKSDKLLMACGCCYELFATETQIANYAKSGDEYDVERKRDCDEIKDALKQGKGGDAELCHDNVYYEVAMGLLVRVYCELTGEDYAKIYARTDKKNHSGRACHMKFFSEGALDDEQYDYMLIDDLFDGNESEVLNNIRRYFDDGNVLLYREFYGGVRWD